MIPLFSICAIPKFLFAHRSSHAILAPKVRLDMDLCSLSSDTVIPAMYLRCTTLDTLIDAGPNIRFTFCTSFEFLRPELSWYDDVH
jgi:hypothetical protein